MVFRDKFKPDRATVKRVRKGVFSVTVPYGDSSWTETVKTDVNYDLRYDGDKWLLAQAAIDLIIQKSER